MNDTLYNFLWWLIPAFLTGTLAGIRQFIRSHNKWIVWNRRNCWKCAGYAKRQGFLGIKIAVFIIACIVILNYCIPAGNDYYYETATVTDQDYYIIPGKHKPIFICIIDLEFENTKIGERTIEVSSHLYDEVSKGDKCIVTIRDGIFRIPVAKEISKLQ